MGAPRVMDTEAEATATALLAQGKPQSIVARMVGASQSTVSRLAHACANRIGSMRQYLQELYLEKVLNRHGKPVAALLARVEDPETKGSDAAACFRVVMEACGIAGRGSLTIQGDVNVQNNLAVDLSQSVNLEASAEDVEQLRARLLSRTKRAT